MIDIVLSSVSTTEKKVEEMKSNLDIKRNLEILNWLSILTSQEKQRNVLSQHQKGTGEYLLRSPKFMDWLDGKHRILWCIGPRKYS